jgi:hypothetical protein
MRDKIVAAIIACSAISAIGGFGAPVICRYSKDESCAENFRTAAAGALAAATTLGTLMAQMKGESEPME